MNDQLELYAVLLPEICKPCGDALLARIKRDTNLYRAAHFCGHTNTLIHADLGEYEGERAVLRWGIVGPITEAEAMQQINELAEKHGAELHVLLDPKQVN